MTVRLFGCVSGHLHSPYAAMGSEAGGGGGAVGRFPLPFYVIEHPQGIALFDCGLHADMVNPEDRYRRGLAAQGSEIETAAEQTTAARLQALDIDPAQVRWVVLSHLHFDHAGGLHQLPNAEVVVQAREWAAGFDPDLSARYFMPRRYFDLGHAVRRIEGEHDLFGDGTVTCLPSYGHTPGHQSLRVRSEAGDHILTSDACYFCATVEERRFPAFADGRAMDRALDALLALSGPDTTMVFGHDPEQWGERPVIATAR